VRHATFIVESKHWRVGSPQHYDITFDALLIGHEASVTALAWCPDSSTSPTLLSASTDSSAILWRQSAPVGAGAALWMSAHRFGDVGGQRLGGFVGALWAARGSEVLAWGWAGGWRRWRCGAGDAWAEAGALTGHSEPVHGVAWSPGGEYLLSTRRVPHAVPRACAPGRWIQCSLDQTARIHGEANGVWRELARPQMHGYDLVHGAWASALRFVSAADEKVARVFDAPQGFVELVRGVAGVQLGDEKVAVVIFALWEGAYMKERMRGR
jgi:WD40 repeat protein